MLQQRTIFLLLILICTVLCSDSILWISDIHMDPFYNCKYIDKTSWCRDQSHFPSPLQHSKILVSNYSKQTIKDHYGKYFFQTEKLKNVVNDSCALFGRYGCNPPPLLIQTILQKMKLENSQPKFIIASGDFVAHQLPSIDAEKQTLSAVVSLFEQFYPTTPIIPCIGNTDVYPDYYMPYNQTDWFSFLFEVWKPWFVKLSKVSLIPLEQFANSFTRGGYYSFEISFNNDLSKVKIIVLNSVAYSTKQNSQKLIDDPFSQFQFLTSELQLAKQNQQQVILITHIGPTVTNFDGKTQWIPQYELIFFSILAQYRDSIDIMFNGHFHDNTFRLYKSLQLLGLIAISGSPIFSNNIGFKQLWLEKSSTNHIQITNYQQYFLDLFQSNRYTKAQWSQYEFAKTYQLSPMNYSTCLEIEQGMSNLISLNGYPLLNQVVSRKNGYYIENRYKFVCEMLATNSEDYQTCMTFTNDGDSGQ